jgi:hypothetical protein
MTEVYRPLYLNQGPLYSPCERRTSELTSTPPTPSSP